MESSRTLLLFLLWSSLTDILCTSTLVNDKHETNWLLIGIIAIIVVSVIFGISFLLYYICVVNKKYSRGSDSEKSKGMIEAVKPRDQNKNGNSKGSKDSKSQEKSKEESKEKSKDESKEKSQETSIEKSSEKSSEQSKDREPEKVSGKSPKKSGKEKSDSGKSKPKSITETEPKSPPKETKSVNEETTDKAEAEDERKSPPSLNGEGGSSSKPGPITLPAQLTPIKTPRSVPPPFARKKGPLPMPIKRTGTEEILGLSNMPSTIPTPGSRIN